VRLLTLETGIGWDFQDPFSEWKALKFSDSSDSTKNILLCWLGSFSGISGSKRLWRVFGYRKTIPSDSPSFITYESNSSSSYNVNWPFYSKMIWLILGSTERAQETCHISSKERKVEERMHNLFSHYATNTITSKERLYLTFMLTWWLWREHKAYGPLLVKCSLYWPEKTCGIPESE
jgi:hypothetical protein